MNEALIAAATIVPSYLVSPNAGDSAASFLDPSNFIAFGALAVSIITLCWQYHTTKDIKHFNRPIMSLHESVVRRLHENTYEWKLLCRNTGKHPATGVFIKITALDRHGKILTDARDTPNRIIPGVDFSQFGTLKCTVSESSPAFFVIDFEYFDLFDKRKKRKFVEREWHKFTGGDKLNHMIISERDEMEERIASSGTPRKPEGEGMPTPKSDGGDGIV